MVLIALTGNKGSGKSLVANFLSRHGFLERTFAGPLKDGLAEMLGLSYDQVHGTQEQKEAIDPFWGVSARRLLQVVGTELFRDYLPKLIPEMRNVWIRRMEKELDGIQSYANRDICISDVRFADEADFIHERGGVVIKLVRGSFASAATKPRTWFEYFAALFGRKNATDTHASETQDVPYDYLIENKGTKEELCAQLLAILDKLK